MRHTQSRSSRNGHRGNCGPCTDPSLFHLDSCTVLTALVPRLLLLVGVPACAGNTTDMLCRTTQASQLRTLSVHRDLRVTHAEAVDLTAEHAHLRKD
jgi:hypothetical protein